MTTADAAEAFLRRHDRQRRRIEARLAEVNRSIAQWEAWEANRRLPRERRRLGLREPARTAADLEELRAMLLDVLAEAES